MQAENIKKIIIFLTVELCQGLLPLLPQQEADDSNQNYCSDDCNWDDDGNDAMRFLTVSIYSNNSNKALVPKSIGVRKN
ncbi:hypothetical protein RND81_10G021500 [Saponaria officinalis]|uniref:Uncharacterized protein n=1 Tax=Saponaria officinalis TaxID=3572 RepID=A0AAW1HZS2_SAPOF